MKKIIYLVIIALTASLYASAQVSEAPQAEKRVRITMNTGKAIDGIIKLENDDVILLVNDKGERYQLQKSSIASIGEPTDNEPVETSQDRGKPFGMTIQASAGGAWAANEKYTNVDADLIMGHRLLLNGAMFLGAGVGYHGLLNKARKWHFLPLYVHMKYTFLPDRKNSPLVSASAGYAFCLTKDVKGGAFGDIALMFHHKIGTRGGINIGAYFRTHGYRATDTVEQDGNVYTGKLSGAIFSVGGRLAIDM